MSFSDVTIYIIFVTYAVRVSIFMTSPLGVAVGLCVYKEVYLHILEMCVL